MIFHYKLLHEVLTGLRSCDDKIFVMYVLTYIILHYVYSMAIKQRAAFIFVYKMT